MSQERRLIFKILGPLLILVGLGLFLSFPGRMLSGFNSDPFAIASRAVSQGLKNQGSTVKACDSCGHMNDHRPTFVMTAAADFQVKNNARLVEKRTITPPNFALPAVADWPSL